MTPLSGHSKLPCGKVPGGTDRICEGAALPPGVGGVCLHSIVRNTLRGCANRFEIELASRFVHRQVNRPLFILGCGRSGTTALGGLLSKHPHIKYLNEPRHMWIACYPEADIWSNKARARKGRIALSAQDVRHLDSRRLHSLFAFQLMKSRKSLLVEKLPINSFRIPFLIAHFPDARFVHIVRNGVEVARSIARRSAAAGWYGKYKWELLGDYARARAGLGGLVNLCHTDYERGLLEWRLSLEAVHDSADLLEPDAFLEVSYADLIGAPAETLTRVLSLIGESPSANVVDCALRHIERRSVAAAGGAPSSGDLQIAGPLLERYWRS